MAENKFLHNFYKVTGRLFRSRNLAILLACASIISIVATYFAIANMNTPVAPEAQNVITLIIIDLILLLSLAVLISKRFIKLIIERRKGITGSRLQTRIVMMFLLMAMIPTIIMVISSAVFFNYGIQSWFDYKVQAAIDGSKDIAHAYLEEHKEMIHLDISAIASDLNHEAINLRRNPRSFNKKLTFYSKLRKVPEALVFQKTGYDQVSILAATNLSLSLQLDLEDISRETLSQANHRKIITLTSDSDDRVIALLRLENFFETYLLVGRFVDNEILNHIATTQGAVDEYNNLKSNISDLQIKFFIVFIMVSLLLLLATAWVGFIFAVDLVKPVSALLDATDKVKKGDFSVRVKEGHINDEMATLSRAFNRMAKQLDRQKKELLAAQRKVAWEDVAKRIAHEIKNPLTPIQLAIERLSKKYAHKVDDAEILKKYLNTISRNASSIDNMVTEFADFARIPAPVFKRNDICEIVSDVIFARDGIAPNIEFHTIFVDKNIMIECDLAQLNQVFTNIIKNAEESIVERQALDKNFSKGVINVRITQENNHCIISIEDNGKGFSKEIKERITEPYVTTKSKGTGIGLAIVKKIIEDHNGVINFKNYRGGACVCIDFPLDEMQEHDVSRAA